MTACLQKVLVTAGPAFIASRLIDRLLGDRYEGTAMYDLTFLETTYETDTPACILIRRFGLSDLRRLLRCLQRAEQGENPGPGRPLLQVLRVEGAVETFEDALYVPLVLDAPVGPAQLRHNVVLRGDEPDLGRLKKNKRGGRLACLEQLVSLPLDLRSKSVQEFHRGSVI